MFINVKLMDSTIYAAAAKVSAVEFFYRPSVQLHHIFFLLQKNFQSTNQFFFSFLNVGEALYSNAQRSRQLRHGLAANPRDVLGAGDHEGALQSCRACLTSDTDTFCSQHAHFLISLLVSILTLSIGLDTTGGWSLTSFSHFTRQEISTINKVCN